jgi:hypothetical protein
MVHTRSCPAICHQPSLGNRRRRSVLSCMVEYTMSMCNRDTHQYQRHSKLQTLYVGCQNTSLQWFDFNTLRESQPESSILPPSSTKTSLSSDTSGTSTPNRKAHKFFDSYPQHERRSADIFATNNAFASLSIAARSSEGCVQLSTPPVAKNMLQIPPSNVIDSAHYGYVYCMALMPSARDGSDDQLLGTTRDYELLVTGSGDESFKVRRPCSVLLAHACADAETHRCWHGRCGKSRHRPLIIFTHTSAPKEPSFPLSPVEIRYLPDCRAATLSFGISKRGRLYELF